MFIGQWGSRRGDKLGRTFCVYKNNKRYYQYTGSEVCSDATQSSWHLGYKDEKSETLNKGFKLWIES